MPFLNPRSIACCVQLGSIWKKEGYDARHYYDILMLKPRLPRIEAHDGRVD